MESAKSAQENSLMEEINYKHQGKQVYRKQTKERTCSGCLFSTGTGNCTKDFRIDSRCMSKGKEYIFVTKQPEPYKEIIYIHNIKIPIGRYCTSDNEEFYCSFYDSGYCFLFGLHGLYFDNDAETNDNVLKCKQCLELLREGL